MKKLLRDKLYLPNKKRIRILILFAKQTMNLGRFIVCYNKVFKTRTTVAVKLTH